MSESKLTSEHLKRDAYLYIRQSSLRQVMEHAESTKRQYALRDRAAALGWPRERIHVIDCDQGKSGSQAAGRDGFQQLVSEVALRKAGIIMGLEVSRFARNSADWHQLIELCALTGTLILDEEGIYDPTGFNDRLLLGLRGTMSEAELHILKARMRGGVLNKARRGDLLMGPPIGLIYKEDGTLAPDPDAEVQAVLRLVFESFHRTGSALQTVRYFLDQGMRFPRRLRSGPDQGELMWTKPQHSRILQILHNPRYAGAFVYGRTRSYRQPNGKVGQLKVAREEWQFVIRDAHQGYISWEQFETNQKRLAENALGFGGERRGGPAREGPALLQGRVLCGLCGERMGVQYERQHGESVPIYICHEESVRRGGRACQRVPGKAIDAAISELLLELMAPLTLEVALAIQEEVEARVAETDTLRRQHVERAGYEAELARRRYMKADPDHRLVADVLEAEWNEKLRIYQAAQEEYERQSKEQRLLIDQDARAKILTIAADFPRVWNDPRIEPKEKKRMLRLLIADVTLVKAEMITAQVRLRGGATRTLSIKRPVPIAQVRKVKAEIVSEIDGLLDQYGDREIADLLNERGYRTWEAKPYTLKKVAFIRRAYGLASRYSRLRAKGYRTARELSAQLEITATTVHVWASQGMLRKHHYDSKSRCLYEPLEGVRILKGKGGRDGHQPTIIFRPSA